MDEAAAISSVLARAERDSDVLAVFLFGSRARGEATSRSDVDVCLVLSRGATVDPTEVRVRYAGSSAADVHVFQRLPLYVRTRVLREGRTLLVKDEDALYELAIRTAQAYEDFKPHYRRYLEAVSGA
ncbi:MAG: nucleotidyltransferase domain-containing protein [Acidobacteria bacterium]|nr:nucleotidyltransferase domain-containing protein [Acidobacteriota bacterium]